MSTTKRALLASLVVTVIGFGSTVVTATAQDQGVGPSPASCGGTHTHSFGTVGFGASTSRIYSNRNPKQSLYLLGAPIPAGTYDLTTVSYDGYEARVNIFQDSEFYFLELLDSGGAVVATSAMSADLPDLVIEATWAGGIGRVTTNADVTAVRVIHGASPADPVPHSVSPVCFGATLVETPTTTSVVETTTTVPDTTTTVPATTTTVVETTTTVPDTTTTTVPDTTTTVPTRVLPEVEVAQPAQPVPSQPSFTG